MMFTVESRSREYLNEWKSRMKAQLAARRELVAAGREQRNSQAGFDAALSTFDPLFFSNLLLALNVAFGHRSLTDGNVLNEVRMLCNSILLNRGVMAADETVQYDASRSVLGVEVGQEIRLNEADFVRLSSAFFEELEAKFAAT
jgi:hypothetical protein